MLCYILMSGAVCAQTAPQPKRAPKFSSVYTDLRKDCRDAWSGRDRQEAVARGQDIPQPVQRLRRLRRLYFLQRG